MFRGKRVDNMRFEGLCSVCIIFRMIGIHLRCIVASKCDAAELSIWRLE